MRQIATKFYLLKKEKPKDVTPNAYHERVPRHGGKKLVEQIGETQFVDDPVVTIDIDNGLVKVENNHGSRHFVLKKKPVSQE